MAPRGGDLTMKEAAAQLGCHIDTVVRLIRAGKLRAYRLGRTVRITEFHLETYRRHHKYTGPERRFGDDRRGVPRPHDRRQED